MTRAGETIVAVVGYARVSTIEQAREGLSLEAQRAKLRSYAQLYGLDLVGTHVDAGASGATLERPGLQEALQVLTRGTAHGLVVVKLDRLTRSIRDLAMLLETYFHRYSLMSVDDRVDTASASGRLLLHIITAVSQWEREVIGERTRDALAVKRAKGERVSRYAPYGYMLADGGTHLTVESREQAAIRMARDLHQTGLSLRQVAWQLERSGYVGRQGRRYSAAAIRRLVEERQP